MAKEMDKQLVILDDSEAGSVKITDDVVAVIAAYAATEVDGVAAMAGNVTSSILSKVGMKNLASGVRVAIEDGVVRIDTAILVKYGYAIPTVSKKVQDKIKASVENMTSLKVTDVNIRIVGIKVNDDGQEA